MKSRILLFITLFACLANTAKADFAGGDSIGVGYAGYCFYDPIIAKIFGGQMKFNDITFGPANHGWSIYNYTCTPVEIKEHLFTETFDLVAGDEVMDLRVHFKLRVRANPEAVKVLVERYNPEPDQWYNLIKESLRTIVRDRLENRKTADINANRVAAGDDIRTATIKFLESTPIELVNLEVGNVEYPREVQDAIKQKMAKVQELQTKQKEVEIATQEANRQVEVAKGQANASIENARGQAEATRLIKAELTPMYIQYLQAQAQLTAASQAGNKTVFFFGDGKSRPVMSYDLSDKNEDEQKLK